ncbi:MAG: glutamine amidotransferase [Thermoleophilaceae bacterium]|nr:glutamine amidotransferase [Thermoleophilaceae bacterium]
MNDSPTLRICALYPSRMNIYADRGNMLLLQHRCEARGIGFELTASEAGEHVDPDAHDLFYIGGGQDSDQIQIAGDMLETKQAALAEAAEGGKVILAVCGGYQLLGEYYELADQKVEGLGIVDLRTVREPGERLIGNVMIEFEVDGSPRVLAGFENHGGRTYLESGCPPLGRVLKGHGNNGKDGFEGVHVNNVFGTYLHGPLLPKNAWFADHLTRLALGGDIELEPLDDDLEDLAHESAIRAAGGGSGLMRLTQR